MGDALVLTKPLGTGVLFNANRSGKLRYADLEKILPLIASLNRRALEAALKFPVHSCTDITGFGIAGHALEMAKGSGLQISLEYKKLPFYPDTLSMYKKGETTGSNKANRKLCEGHLKIAASLSREEEELLFDPQTSGGLLLALPAGQADDLVKALQAAGVVHAVKIGEVIRAEQAGVRVV